MADIFDDLFGDVMGRRGGRANGRERGSDIRYDLEIGLEEAYNGKTATIQVPTSVTCEVCTGSGAKAGSQPRTCPTCAGHGRVRAQQGFFAIERTCPTCSGRGQIIDNPCQACAGAGRVTRERTLVRQRAEGRRGRHPDPARRRGRGRPAGRPRRRSLPVPDREAPCDLPSRRSRSLLPGADLVRSGERWAANLRCVRSTAARRR